MPKMKTKRAARKRFRYTGGGLVRCSRANGSHILTKKNRKRKRRLKQTTTVHKHCMKQVQRMLPYGAD
jgi:large subunit ribosomal protein L35